MKCALSRFTRSFLQRVSVSNQHSRLINAVMLITENRKNVSARLVKWDKGELPEDANSARVEHQRKRELHRISQPALGKGAKQMSMCHQQNIRRILSMHVVLVHRANLLNEIIKTVRHLLRRPGLTRSDILDRRRLDLNSKEIFF
jgi:hypothetical protein